MTEPEKLDAGLEYCCLDKEVSARKLRALKLCREFNRTDSEDEEREQQILEELFGSIFGTASVQPGFNCDNCKNIINYNVTILDITQRISATGA